MSQYVIASGKRTAKFDAAVKTTIIVFVVHVLNLVGPRVGLPSLTIEDATLMTEAISAVYHAVLVALPLIVAYIKQPRPEDGVALLEGGVKTPVLPDGTVVPTAAAGTV